MPLSMHEVQRFSRHVHGHRQGLVRGAGSRGLSPLMRSSPGSASSVSAGTVMHSSEGDTDIGLDYVHLQLCNSCGNVRVFLRVSARDEF